ncbi:hypothetical protein [Hydrogenophaga sp. BPS33]|uniref:hypothetical protein n=1 Tax=Hydrogenophaga sp. BPS33 TaxID=2651974 RepID=UPI00131FA846|nr:hypothetical protein [Hydrogenophaga sp. BPS33]QHE85899.1 hypothetical protein F9K07_13785 [Hydrogenophaga sp. BPS33]
MEKELELAARRQGVTKSQFIVDAVERALGRKNPYELLVALKAEESRPEYKVVSKAFKGVEQAYESEASRAAIVKKLKAKHGGRAG